MLLSLPTQEIPAPCCYLSQLKKCQLYVAKSHSATDACTILLSLTDQEITDQCYYFWQLKRCQLHVTISQCKRCQQHVAISHSQKDASSILLSLNARDDSSMLLSLTVQELTVQSRGDDSMSLSPTVEGMPTPCYYLWQLKRCHFHVTISHCSRDDISMLLFPVKHCVI